VRFIGNFSSGKMGYAIALELANRGAKVFLVSGPTHLTVNHPNIQVIKVTSAEQMFREAKKIFPITDFAVLAAAVADYRPAKQEQTKIKKKDEKLVIELVKNPDIAAELGKIKQPKQLLIGFALETNNEVQNAIEKLKKKNFDFIVLNSLRDKGAGFGTDTNKVKFIFPDGRIKEFPLKSKAEVASDIADQIAELLGQKI
jgi:phosphopantothenoylcysteine decarboxylase/phosphopantothenate--cysteine ligase